MGEQMFDRRDFLRTGGALIVSFAMMPSGALGQTAPAGKSLATDEVDSFLVIGRDGSVTLYSGKVDIGTGTRAAYRQIVTLHILPDIFVLSGVFQLRAAVEFHLKRRIPNQLRITYRAAPQSVHSPLLGPDLRAQSSERSSE